MTVAAYPIADAQDSPLRARGSRLHAFVRVLLMVGFTLAIWPVALLATRPLKGSSRLRALQRWTSRWCGGLLPLTGFRLRVSGPTPPDGVFLAPNHQGYLDVLALGAAAPCLFVAKAEVEDWPLVGPLFTSTGHVGLRRESRRSLHSSAHRINTRLKSGCRTTIFLEGTSTGGDRVLPFRPSLLQAALETNTPVVPVAIRYHTPAGMDVSEDVAYWKDHVFAPHVWRLLGLRGGTAEVVFGEPIAPPSDGNRKLWARQLHEQVALLLARPSRSHNESAS